MTKYQIGDLDLMLQDRRITLQQDSFIKSFIKIGKEKNDTIKYELCFTDLERYSKGILLQKNGLYELYDTAEGEFIIYHWATCRFAFGFKLEDLEKDDAVTCYFNPEMKNQIPLSLVRFLSCAGLHSKLLQKGALVFHAAYIDWEGEAILLAGQSGTGKSTQANLWEQYANAEIINGDRALIRQKEGSWKVYGYPCCGSSSICINRTLPLKAIVLLEQGDENRVCALTSAQKYKMILTGSERYLWSEKELERVSEIAEKIIEDIPIMKLVCRPNEDAVDVLKKALEEC